MKVTFKVFRFNPETEKTPHYEVFRVEANPNERILDCLNRIRWEQDSSLAFRMSCAHGICGSDGLTINGSSALACQKLVKDYDYSKEITVEPLKFFPVIKDLNVDMEPFFTRIGAINPEVHEPQAPLDETASTERTQSPEERSLFDDAVKCILCACCVAACPVNLKEEPEFVGPAAFLRAQRYLFDSRTQDSIERMRVLEKPHGVWSCKSYYQCTRVCPKKIRVTEAILQTKKKILQELHPKERQEV
ncbi:MAG TPA: succinate dehydrogenase iron-sulfur subunit [Candidatus Bathyarchaeia archaeon]|nr:succinate dehydrogenase iron-sulfur subunit [Candidatus Bathyarchaeia archaeon]